MWTELTQHIRVGLHLLMDVLMKLMFSSKLHMCSVIILSVTAQDGKEMIHEQVRDCHQHLQAIHTHTYCAYFIYTIYYCQELNEMIRQQRTR